MAHLQYGFALGGLERVVLELATRARRWGVVPTVIAFGPDGPMRGVLEEAGVRVEWFRDAPGLSPRTWGAIAGALRSSGAALVHAHDLGPFLNAIPAAQFASRLPVMVTLHQSARPGASLRILGCVAARLAAGVVACGSEVAHAARAWGFEPTHVIENGIALGPPATPEERRTARAALGVADGTVVVGCVGRLSREKGPDVLLEAHLSAFGGRADVRLAFVGDGPMRAELERRARAGRGGVTFLGARRDARALLAGLDVYAQTSRSEGRSLALLEAMAASLPSIASRIPAVEELHAHGRTALLCEVGDRGAVAEALTALVGSAPERSRLGAAARQRAAACDVDAMVEAYVRLYRTVACGRAGAPAAPPSLTAK